ncbi:MAG TPA: molybdenum ABC transporter ATP-binding protein, partial [Methylibium sp.]
ESGRVRAAGPLTELLARADLPLAGADDGGVVLDACVLEHDTRFGLTRIAVEGATLWVGALEQPLGSAVRARVLARDVSIVRSVPADSSILNVLPVTLRGWHCDATTVLLSLALGHADARAEGLPRSGGLLARITRRSFETLQLRQDEALHAQIKGVSLMR